MTVALIQQRVQERLEAGLLPALLERQNKLHAKRSWRDCDCAFCEVKRRATVVLGRLTIRASWDPSLQAARDKVRAELNYERERV
jgi:hypothetical protein